MLPRRAAKRLTIIHAGTCFVKRKFVSKFANFEFKRFKNFYLNLKKIDKIHTLERVDFGG